MSQAYSCRPSELLAVEDPHDAFRLDRAVWLFGTELTAELKKADGKTDAEIQRKQDRILRKWIPESAESPQRFANPRGTRLP